MRPEQLSSHISERSGNSGIDPIDNFDEWYQEQFPNNPDGYTERPMMVLVGLGADDKTRRMVDFLAQGGVNITLITFNAYKKDGELLLARLIETEKEDNGPRPVNRLTKSETLAVLKELSESIGSAELINIVGKYLRNHLQAYEKPSKTGLSYSLVETAESGLPSYRVYISVYISESKPGQVQLVFQKRAIQAAKNNFEEFKNRYSERFFESHGNYYLWIKSIPDWEGFREPLKPILTSIIEGWKIKTNNMESIEEEKAQI
jgi:hypothetical protein